MRLLNHSLGLLSLSILLILGIWGGIFYYAMMDEVLEGVDAALVHQKKSIIYHFEADQVTSDTEAVFINNSRIQEIPEAYAWAMRDYYTDTLIRSFSDNDLETFRMLTSAFKFDNKYYQVQVFTSTVEKDDLLEQLFLGMIWLYVFIILSVLLVHNLALRKIWTPFYTILEWMKGFRIDREDAAPMVKTRVKEFKELNEAVQNLVQYAAEAYQQQAQFIENAAHELQTPLAISLNRLELLMEEHNLNERAMQEIQRVIDSLSRLTRLNKTLLLLSRIENKQFKTQQPLSISTLVDKLFQDLSEIIQEKGLSLELDVQSDWTLNIHEDLAFILFSNLIRNAIQHNIPGGIIRVRIYTGAFLIENTGSMGAMTPDRIFQRFYKDNLQNGGLGLGLAIVKAIADYYRISLQYTYVNNLHRIQLQKA